MINRAAVILKYKDPAVKWINEVDPYSDNPEITKDNVNEERTVYLVSDEDADTPDDLLEWIKANHQALFESELEGWYSDESLWPEKRDFSLFQEWVDIECHTVLIDTVGSTILDDET